MSGNRARDPDPLFYDGRDEDIAILPEDRSSPVTDQERAYYAARMTTDKALELWGLVLRQAIIDAKTCGDQQVISDIADSLGLDGPGLLRTASRTPVRGRTRSVL